MISLVDNVINRNKLKCSLTIGVLNEIPGSKIITEVIIKDLPEGACSHPSTPGPEEHEEVTIPTDRRVTDLKILRKVAKIVEIPINASRANAGPGTQIAMPVVPGATCLRGVGIGLATDLPAP